MCEVYGDEATKQDSWITILGIRGAVLGLGAGIGEGPDVLVKVLRRAVSGHMLGQVEHVATGAPSPKLTRKLSSLFSSLQGVSLDPQHLSFRVDRHTQKNKIKPTIVGLLLRVVMRKFEIPHASLAGEMLYSGGKVAAFSTSENTFRMHIAHDTLPHDQAKRILNGMNPNTTMLTLTSFARILAAVVRMYPERMDSKCDKTTLRQVFLNATKREKFEWLLNNARYRSSLPSQLDQAMGSGTTRNEQVHQRLNAHFRKVKTISKRMLATELKLWHVGDALVSTKMIEGGLSRRMRRADILPIVATSVHLFSSSTWSTFVQTPRQPWAAASQSDMHPRQRRCGPTSTQSDIYDNIMKKMQKLPRLSMFDA